MIIFIDELGSEYWKGLMSLLSSIKCLLRCKLDSHIKQMHAVLSEHSVLTQNYMAIELAAKQAFNAQ